MKVKETNAVARLVLRDVSRMKPRELQTLCTWLQNQSIRLRILGDEYSNHFTSTLLYKRKLRNGTSARNRKQ